MTRTWKSDPRGALRDALESVVLRKVDVHITERASWAIIAQMRGLTLAFIELVDEAELIGPGPEVAVYLHDLGGEPQARLLVEDQTLDGLKTPAGLPGWMTQEVIVEFEPTAAAPVLD